MSARTTRGRFRSRPVLVPGALVAAWLATCTIARAAAPPAPAVEQPQALGAVTVVIASAALEPSLAEITRRVAAELAAAGFRVSAESCAPGLQRGCGRPWPAGASAVAAVGFAWSGAAVAIEARVARAELDRPVRLQALVAGPPGPEPAVVAVRATELVRAGVLAVLRGEDPAAELAAPAVAAPPGSARAAAFVEAGPALVQSTAGLGSAWGPALRAGATFGGAWFAAAWIVAPTLAAELRVAAGGAELRSQIGGLELGRRWRPTAPVYLALGLGGGVYHLGVRGKEVAPLAAAESSLWTPFGAAGASVAWAFSRRWLVAANLRAAFVKTAPVVRIGAIETGRGGRPLLVAALGVEFYP